MRIMLPTALVLCLGCETQVELPQNLSTPQDTVVAKVVGSIGWGTKENHEFGEVSGVAFGPSGEVVTVDRFLNQVAIFDSSGAFLRAFGRKGDGPGEFINPIGVGVLDGGEIGVVSADRGHRFSVFSWDGEPLSTSAMVYGGQAKPWLGVVSDGETVYDWASDFSKSKDPFETSTIAQLKMSRTGVTAPRAFTVLPYHFSVSHGVPVVAPNGRKASYRHPFQDVQLWSVAADGTWASLTQDSLAVRVSGYSGETLFELPMAPLQEMTRNDERVARDYMESNNPEYQIGEIRVIEKLPVQSVYLDPYHRLWVSKTPWAEIKMRESAAIADRYDLDGEPPLSIVLPEGLRPHRPYFTAQEDKALGIVSDRYGRQTVLILEIPRR